MSRRSALRRWAALAPAAVYYAGIFLLSAQSRLPSVVSFRFSDKLIHAMTFAGFGACLIGGFGRFLSRKPKAAAWAAVLVGAAGAGLDEIHQIFVPLRNADVGDAVADVIGVLAAVGAAACLRRRGRGRRDGAAEESPDGGPA